MSWLTITEHLCHKWTLSGPSDIHHVNIYVENHVTKNVKWTLLCRWLPGWKFVMFLETRICVVLDFSTLFDNRKHLLFNLLLNMLVNFLLLIHNLLSWVTYIQKVARFITGDYILSIFFKRYLFTFRPWKIYVRVLKTTVMLVNWKGKSREYPKITSFTPLRRNFHLWICW
jgi:hypothetical protein